jgi:hypothetical protein
MKAKISPKNTAGHFRSSPVLEVGAGIAPLSLSSSIWNPGTAQAYAHNRERATRRP